MKKLLNLTWGWIKPYLTPKMLPIVLAIWVFTNGIWYFLAFVDIGLPKVVMQFAKGYLVFLYTPWAAEKPLVIFPLSMLIYKMIYKEDFKKKKVKEE